MKLQEKFKQWLNTKPNETLRDIQCEIITDEFAIGFVEWKDKISDSDLRYSAKYAKSNEELLKIYKTEKEL